MLSCCCHQRLLHIEHGICQRSFFIWWRLLCNTALSFRCSCQRSVWLDCWSKSARRTAAAPK